MAQIPSFSLDDMKDRMQKSIASLRDELQGLRTGRASASLLEPVMVEAYGTRMPLNQIATVTVPESRMLLVSVWDRTMAPAVDKAIRNSGLGLNPSTEGATSSVTTKSNDSTHVCRHRFSKPYTNSALMRGSREW